MAKTSYVLPIGTAVYPKITKPDTKGQYADNKYKTDLELTPKDLAQVQADVATMVKRDFKGKNPRLPFVEKEDGLILVRAKSKFLPLIIDAKKKVLFNSRTDDPSVIEQLYIGGGSRIRIGVTPYIYDKGLSFQLDTVQIIELAEGALDGFDVVDDGYEPEGDEASTEGFETEGESGLDI